MVGVGMVNKTWLHIKLQNQFDKGSSLKKWIWKNACYSNQYFDKNDKLLSIIIYIDNNDFFGCNYIAYKNITINFVLYFN